MEIARLNEELKSTRRKLASLQEAEKNFDRIGFIAGTLSLLKEPWLWIERIERTKIYSDVEVVRALKRLRAQRNPKLNCILEKIPTQPLSSAVVVWASATRFDWYLEDCEEDNVLTLLAAAENYRGNPRLRIRLLEQVLRLFWKIASDEQIMAYISRSEDLLLKLSNRTKIELLHALTHRNITGNVVVSIKHSLQESPYVNLRLMALDFLHGRAPNGWTHETVEQLYTKHAGSTGSDVIELILPVYQTLRKQMRFIDVRNDTIAQEEMWSRFADALATKEPLSLVRLGDGEAYLFSENPRFLEQADIANRERHWWGLELTPELRSKIAGQALSALRSADVVGIPSIYRIIQSTSESVGLTKSVHGRCLLEVLTNLGDAVMDTALLTESSANVALFTNPSRLRELCEVADKTILVTSIKSDALPPEIASLPNLVTLSVPTHHRTATNARYCVGSKPLPLVYETILEKVNQMTGPGTLVLVSAGLIGKIIIGNVRSRGGVAIDFGSVIDDMVASRVPTLR